MMTGFRLKYLGATLSLALAATSKTVTYLLLRYYVDDVLGQGESAGTLLLIALGFVGLALFEGTFTFLSGRLAAQTAEGVVQRLRNYLFDHIQRLSFTYHDHSQTGELVQRSTSDVDALRRFFADQAIGVGALLRNRGTAGRADFRLFLQAGFEGVRSVSGTGSYSLQHFAGESDRRAGGQGLCPTGLRTGSV
jgi:ABC-type multidrug transport system fused ATPase/permease subunit